MFLILMKLPLMVVFLLKGLNGLISTKSCHERVTDLAKKNGLITKVTNEKKGRICFEPGVSASK